MTFRWPWETAPQHQPPPPDGDEMPPRPRTPEPSGGPVTVPRLWAPMGPLNPEDDPCGAPQPPVRTRRKP